MTRGPNRRQIRDDLDDLGDDIGDDELPDEYVINYQVVGQDGNIVDTFERVLWVRGATAAASKGVPDLDDLSGDD